MKNIVLIGMPGAGKSTIGVVLAKIAGINFVDTDLLIQQQEGKLLQVIVDEIGCDNFITLEGDFLSAFKTKHVSVVATGGSAVYTEKAMNNLKNIGNVVYLQLPYEEIEKRIHNITTRGLAMAKGKTLLDLYEERLPLYQKYADLIIDCFGKTIEEIALEILNKVKKG
ncbi:MAG: shikimate kinase [Spirochaetales bacterium]|jgi:shikimate kinase|nr:shikimate kinase [Spirochaetales bacterium]